MLIIGNIKILSIVLLSLLLFSLNSPQVFAQEHNLTELFTVELQIKQSIQGFIDQVNPVRKVLRWWLSNGVKTKGEEYLEKYKETGKTYLEKKEEQVKQEVKEEIKEEAKKTKQKLIEQIRNQFWWGIGQIKNFITNIITNYISRIKSRITH